ncbi:MAG TPA: copper-containing nitrite reductase [Candidatus Limnocylindria bacterium]|nr:copper-containing nitrite reductase [Candidatus Limnocylindria bacterium]
MTAVAGEQRSDVVSGALTGGLFGALAIGLVTALTVGVLGATGGIRSGTESSTTTTTATASTAAPAAPANAAPVALAPAKALGTKSIARPASSVAPALSRSVPATVRVDLETQEVVAEIEKGATYSYWTFNGTIPGPMVRVRVGDTVELHMKNSATSILPHSIDLHAVNGPGGGAGATQTNPGKETMVTFKALNPGLYVYHCATAPIPMHIANGMYGLILVEPEGGLPPVDREFYVMQGELYTNARLGITGHHDFDAIKMDLEEPDYVLFNGKTGSLTGEAAMTAKVGERVRIYFGVGGFLPSSLHLIGEIFDRVYPEGAVGSSPNANVQTTLVPAGGATMVEFTLDVPGTYLLVDHALPRAINKGAVAQLVVTGPADATIYSGTGSGH